MASIVYRAFEIPEIANEITEHSILYSGDLSDIASVSQYWTAIAPLEPLLDEWLAETEQVTWSEQCDRLLVLLKSHPALTAEAIDQIYHASTAPDGALPLPPDEQDFLGMVIVTALRAASHRAMERNDPVMAWKYLKAAMASLSHWSKRADDFGYRKVLLSHTSLLNEMWRWATRVEANATSFRMALDDLSSLSRVRFDNSAAQKWAYLEACELFNAGTPPQDFTIPAAFRGRVKHSWTAILPWEAMRIRRLLGQAACQGNHDDDSPESARFRQWKATTTSAFPYVTFIERSRSWDSHKTAPFLKGLAILEFHAEHGDWPQTMADVISSDGNSDLGKSLDYYEYEILPFGFLGKDSESANQMVIVSTETDARITISLSTPCLVYMASPPAALSELIRELKTPDQVKTFLEMRGRVRVLPLASLPDVKN